MPTEPSEPGHDQRPETWSAGAGGYESAFAPFTGAYAEVALDLLGVAAGDRLLDVATGTGAVSLRAAALGAEVLATDFAPGMVELVGDRLAAAGHASARTAVMDGQALELDDDAFDAAISMFGLIFFPDMDRGARELARVVRPGGRVAIGTWNLAGFRLVDLVQQALSAVVAGLPSPTPSWARVGDADGLSVLLRDAGLTDVVVHVVTSAFAPDDPAEFFRRLPDWSPPVQPLFEVLDEATIERGAEAFVVALDDLSDDALGGMPVEALIGIGTAGAG